jgi:DMSO/TMAO reductase YedYZ heme-binding membrane subunit
VNTWVMLRAAGIGSYLMLFATVAWGLVGTTSVVGKKVSKATAVAVHQFLSTVGFVLLGVHLAGLLLDRFVPFGPLDLLIPLRASFKPWATALGILAMYAVVIVLVSSWARKRLGTRWWRRLHLLAVPAFAMAMVHGAFAGTDTVRPWMWLTYLATGGIVVFLMLLRALTVGMRAVRSARPAARTVRPHRPPLHPEPGREPALEDASVTA